MAKNRFFFILRINLKTYQLHCCRLRDPSPIIRSTEISPSVLLNIFVRHSFPSRFIILLLLFRYKRVRVAALLYNRKHRIRECGRERAGSRVTLYNVQRTRRRRGKRILLLRILVMRRGVPGDFTGQTETFARPSARNAV